MLRAAGGVTAGLAGASGLDYLQNPDSKYPLDTTGSEGSNRWRYGNFGINATLLGMAPFLHKVPHRFAALSAPFAKDLMVKAMPALDSVQKNMNTQRQAAKDTTANQNLALAGGAALGAGALGIGGAALLKYLSTKDRVNGPRMHVTLPTKNPNDRETEVDMPMDDDSISPAQQERLHRDVRKRLRGETRERTLKLDPETRKLISLDQWERKFGDQAPKTASERLANVVRLANNLWK